MIFWKWIGKHEKHNFLVAILKKRSQNDHFRIFFIISRIDVHVPPHFRLVTMLYYSFVLHEILGVFHHRPRIKLTALITPKI